MTDRDSNDPRDAVTAKAGEIVRLLVFGAVRGGFDCNRLLTGEGAIVRTKLRDDVPGEILSVAGPSKLNSKGDHQGVRFVLPYVAAGEPWRDILS